MIWIVGSSLIKKAFTHVKSSPLGDDIGLRSFGYNVIWVGHPGLSFTQVDGICGALKNYSGNNHPRYLVVHAGGYDIGWLNARALRQLMINPMSNLMTLFPNTCII